MELVAGRASGPLTTGPCTPLPSGAPGVSPGDETRLCTLSPAHAASRVGVASRPRAAAAAAVTLLVPVLHGRPHHEVVSEDGPAGALFLHLRLRTSTEPQRSKANSVTGKLRKPEPPADPPTPGFRQRETESKRRPAVCAGPCLHAHAAQLSADGAFQPHQRLMGAEQLSQSEESIVRSRLSIDF